MQHPEIPVRAIVLASTGASDAGSAASESAAFLGAVPGVRFLSAAGGAAAGSPVGLARAVAVDDAGCVLVLAAQAGRAVHSRELPVRVDAVDGTAVPTWHLLVTVPAYASAAPQPAARLALVRSALGLLQAGADTQGLVEEAEAWRRGAENLARTDAKVGELVRAWEQHSPAPEAADAVAAEAERHLRWLADR